MPVVAISPRCPQRTGAAHRLNDDDDDDRSLVSGRMNASEEILEKHYDRRSERKKAEQRRNLFDL